MNSNNRPNPSGNANAADENFIRAMLVRLADDKIKGSEENHADNAEAKLEM